MGILLFLRSQSFVLSVHLGIDLSLLSTLLFALTANDCAFILWGLIYFWGFIYFWMSDYGHFTVLLVGEVVLQIILSLFLVATISLFNFDSLSLDSILTTLFVKNVFLLDLLRRFLFTLWSPALQFALFAR